MPVRPPLRLAAFVMDTVSHIQHGLWRHPEARQHEFDDVRMWIDLAKTLERGRFDTLFFADVVGLYGPADGDYTVNAREGLQVPNADPSILAAALATHTEHLGLAFTSSVLQAHPFEFARRVSTLDHLSRGRIGWNIVTSALDGAARNFGHDRLEEHDERYAWAQEYVDVVAKLWEGSWDDDAFRADKAAGVVSDASGIHRIDHVGQRYRVAGPHLSKPSPQRTPVLFQAGSSPAGRAFAARNAEAQFILTSTREKTAELIASTRADVAAAGRLPEDLLFFLGLTFVIGSTEEEARRRSAEIDELLSPDGFLLHSNLGYDPETGAALDPDTPLSQVKTQLGQSHLQWLREASPDREPTIRDLAGLSAKLRARVVGTPEQIADELEQWQDIGVDGINVMNWWLPGSYEEFVDHVVPTLQDRGLVQREYAEGTLRRKLFGHDQLPDRHPARRWRRAFS
ncbi:NtaA/DmoA family FMN-dependent monooxygenase [Microbacterium sp. MEC084]|uniref:LLM class flavin-dependent oxidoreductase n=1 Tax=Microbacterium sp. MEC084 TaxID=1963027 RepID=UPI00107059F2|nr:LLM class flavin-dependent oxidoreductase [Microbacterium sp. MEC084]MCD1269585.1 NtaA/DmoA family FMN-dependent monooxygenase [Microbacterium sp. MEC084]